MKKSHIRVILFSIFAVLVVFVLDLLFWSVGILNTTKSIVAAIVVGLIFVVALVGVLCATQISKNKNS